MEEVVNRNSYPRGIALRIETMGSITVSIANRWMIGWPERVEALLREGSYMSSLWKQADQEKDALADATNLQHLSRAEILEIYGISDSPPFPGQ